MSNVLQTICTLFTAIFHVGQPLVGFDIVRARYAAAMCPEMQQTDFYISFPRFWRKSWLLLTKCQNTNYLGKTIVVVVVSVLVNYWVEPLKFVLVLGPKGVRIAVTQTAFSQTGQQDSDYHITLPVSLSISRAEARDEQTTFGPLASKMPLMQVSKRIFYVIHKKTASK